MRVVLVDNEKPLLDELEYLLNKCQAIEISAMFTDPVEALKEIDSLKPDAVFLDIDMPVLNGLNLAREIADLNKDIAIVFLTAFNDYAVQAFEINAIDYVMKPIRKDRLNITIEKLNTRLARGSSLKERMADKIAALANDTKLAFDKVIAFDGEEYNVIAADDILYIEVEKKDTLIFTKQVTYRTRKSLELWKNSLPNRGFFQCHRSFIVNLKHIVKISPMFNNNYVIKLQGTSFDIPVGKSHIAELKKILNL
ncbi:transcriptional regulatory protein YpdB [Peptococcaceae bacterium CEB3]|nr:transcriptional regulatory protein YpdB [Peptococcaceae bacterium CEB3]